MLKNELRKLEEKKSAHDQDMRQMLERERMKTLRAEAQMKEQELN